MKSYAYALLALFGLFFVSCAPRQVTFKAVDLPLTDEEENNRLENVRIVEVKDNRLAKEDALGFIYAGFFEKKVPYIISMPLKDYLMISLNKLIAKDTSDKNFVPVFVRLDEFHTDIYATFFNEVPYFKYSIQFEFPDMNNNMRQIQILDSLVTSKNSLSSRFSLLVKQGIRDAAQNFISYYRNILTKPVAADAKYSALPGEMKQETELPAKDSIDFKKINPVETKSGVLFKYYAGQNIDKGFMFSYLLLSNAKGSKWEFGSGYGAMYFKAKPKENLSSGYIFGLTAPLIIRYNFSDELDGFFLNGNLHLLAGTESENGSKTSFFFGPILEESIGVYIGKSISLTAGVYQFGLLGSKVLSSDFGFIFNISVTGKYKK